MYSIVCYSVYTCTYVCTYVCSSIPLHGPLWRNLSGGAWRTPPPTPTRCGGPASPAGSTYPGVGRSVGRSVSRVHGAEDAHTSAHGTAAVQRSSAGDAGLILPSGDRSGTVTRSCQLGRVCVVRTSTSYSHSLTVPD